MGDNDNDESCEKPYYRLLYGVEIFNSTFVISIVTINARIINVSVQKETPCRL